jgi:hypothetical protein
LDAGQGVRVERRIFHHIHYESGYAIDLIGLGLGNLSQRIAAAT